MPAKRKYPRRKIGRKRYQRKFKPMRALTPYSIVRKLPYAHQISLTPGAAGVVDANIFRLSSVYDPDETGVGATARGFDIYKLLYENFVVLGAKVQVTFINFDLDSPIMCGIAFRSTTVEESDPYAYVASADDTWAIMNTAGASNSIRKMTKYYSLKKWLRRPLVTAAGDVEGGVASNPAENVYAHVWVGDPVGADSGSVRVITHIEYIVKFTKPKTSTVSP